MSLELGTPLLREKYIRAELCMGGVKPPLIGTKQDQIKPIAALCGCTAAKIATEGVRGIFREGNGMFLPALLLFGGNYGT